LLLRVSADELSLFASSLVLVRAVVFGQELYTKCYYDSKIRPQRNYEIKEL